MDRHDQVEMGTVALSLLRFEVAKPLQTTRFKSFDDTDAAHLYFEQISGISDAERQLFGNNLRVGTNLGMTEERSGEIAFAVVKFETYYKTLDFDRPYTALEAWAQLIGVEVGKFLFLVLHSQHALERETANVRIRAA